MTPIRCPYCVEGKSFKAMVAQGNGGEWHMCVRCGHLIVPTNSSFKCTCAKCVNLTSVLLQRSRPLHSFLWRLSPTSREGRAALQHGAVPRPYETAQESDGATSK